MLFVLVLLSCCASGWAVAVPQDEDLQSSIIFNQLAIAQVLDNLKNLSNGDATVSTHLDQLSQNQKTQIQQMNEGLARVTSSVDVLSQALTSHLQQDDVINREIRICTNISEALRGRTGLQENRLKSQQDANARLESKRLGMEERIRQARISKQQLQERLLRLQAEELQRKHEEVQVKTENLEAKSTLQRVEGEEGQLVRGVSLLEQELRLAKERTKHIEVQIRSIKQKIGEVTRAKDELIQTKSRRVDEKNTLSQSAHETEELLKRLTAENSRLEEETASVRANGENLTRTKSELEQQLNPLTIKQAELQTGLQRAGETERSLRASVTSKTQEINKIEAQILEAETDYIYCR